MSTASDADRMLRKHAASTLAEEALVAARACEMGAPAWHFYHGVEAAALHVLHPEMAAARDGSSWLDSQHPAFRDGFLKASTALSSPGPADGRPHRIRLPEPPEA